MSSLIRLECDSLPYTIVIEDNDRVAYAYLLHGDSIVGDVWLYNVCPAPKEPEWRQRGAGPFANPVGYVSNSPFARIGRANDIAVSWIAEGGHLASVEVSVGDTLLAILVPGVKPGYCRNAVKDGPLAKRIPECPGPAGLYDRGDGRHNPTKQR